MSVGVCVCVTERGESDAREEEKETKDKGVFHQCLQSKGDFCMWQGKGRKQEEGEEGEGEMGLE